MELSDWFKGFEKGINCLNSEQLASFFSECGKNCVNLRNAANLSGII